MKNMLIVLFTFFFAVKAGAQSFTKVSGGQFVNTPGDSRSVNWVDVNNDNYLDCMFTNGPGNGQNNSLYINISFGGSALGNFTLLTGDSIVLDNKPSDGATWADMNNDGDEEFCCELV